MPNQKVTWLNHNLAKPFEPANFFDWFENDIQGQVSNLTHRTTFYVNLGEDVAYLHKVKFSPWDSTTAIQFIYPIELTLHSVLQVNCEDEEQLQHSPSPWMMK